LPARRRPARIEAPGACRHRTTSGRNRRR
jgi:hypothetical protein